jgi:hypothetical protein
MTAPLRPCSKCGRHVRTDATRCPFCDAELGVLHALPVVPSPFADHRPAPKYGGPPFRRPITWIGLLFFVSLLATVAFGAWRIFFP